MRGLAACLELTTAALYYCTSKADIIVQLIEPAPEDAICVRLVNEFLASARVPHQRWPAGTGSRRVGWHHHKGWDGALSSEGDEVQTRGVQVVRGWRRRRDVVQRGE